MHGRASNPVYHLLPCLIAIPPLRDWESRGRQCLNVAKDRRLPVHRAHYDRDDSGSPVTVTLDGGTELGVDKLIRAKEVCAEQQDNDVRLVDGVADRNTPLFTRRNCLTCPNLNDALPF